MEESLKRAPVLILGEVLFDVFPQYRRIGGAPFNVACHLHHLGIPVHFVSRVGNDDPGREVLEFARRIGLPVAGIQVDPAKPTGEVRVIMQEDGGHRFDILHDRAYDYLDADPVLEWMKDNAPSYVYFGTLALRNPVTAESIRTLIAALEGNSRVVVDLNLRPPFYNRDGILFTLESADVLKVNDQELLELKSMFALKGTASHWVKTLMERFSLHSVAVTRGAKGSLLYDSDREEPLRCSPVPPPVFVNEVGAGDGFCALWLYGMIQNWAPRTLLERASLFAGSVCGLDGALTESPEFYRAFRWT